MVRSPDHMRILITGGAGFIGRHLVHKYLESDDVETKLIIIDNQGGSGKPAISDFDVGKIYPPESRFSDKKSAVDDNKSYYKNKIVFYKEDVRNTETISDIIKRERIDTCIHLAALTDAADSANRPSETMDVNVNGTISLLEACSKNPASTVVFASSAAVYGESTVNPTPEDSDLRPISPYGESKVKGEQLLFSYYRAGKIKSALSLRFFNVYGIGQNPSYAGVITKFADRLLSGMPPIIYGTGEQTRDFISVKDVASAITLAVRFSVEHSGDDPTVPRIFNIGTGNPTSIQDLAMKMSRSFGLDLEPLYERTREHDIIHSCADVARTRNVLRFFHQENLDSFMEQMVSLRTGKS